MNQARRIRAPVVAAVRCVELAGVPGSPAERRHRKYATERLVPADIYLIRQGWPLPRAAGHEWDSLQLDLILREPAGRLQEHHESAERRGGRLTVDSRRYGRIAGNAC